jgi:hypothetical protein
MPVNTKQTLPPILILFLIIVMGFQIFTAIPNAYCSDGQWQHIGDNEGVSLYRSLKETDGLLPFKADAELDAPYERIVMTLVDAEGKPDWAPKLKATAIHSQISSNQFVYSEYYRTPWPFKDREFLLDGTVIYEQNRVVFSAVNAANISLARKDHLKANIQELTFTVTPLSASRTRVAFTFSGDLGGWIPEFVKTIIQKRWPVRFIQALRDRVANNGQLETPRYRSLEKATLEVD